MIEACKKAIWEGFHSQPCGRPVRFIVKNKATGHEVRFCGIHVRRYQGPYREEYYEVKPVSEPRE